MNIQLTDEKYRKTYRVLGENKNADEDFIECDKIGIDFDAIAVDFKAYLKANGKDIDTDDNFFSCDSIIVNENEYIFIEFKDAKIESKKKKNINSKVIQSCFILENIEHKFVFDMDIKFILVYSSKKNNNENIDNYELKSFLEAKSEEPIKFNLSEGMKKIVNSVVAMNEIEFLKYINN